MRFITIFTLTALLFGSVLYGLVVAVDPYNKLGNNLFDFESKAVDFARQNKFNQVEHATKDYTAFIFGSSSAHRYQTKELNRLTGLVSYNYSTQSATPEDYIAMLRHVLTKYHPKLLLLSLDFEILNAETKTDDMFYSSPLKKYLTEARSENDSSALFNNSYLTLEAVRDTFQVIWVNLFGKALHSYLEDGDHVLEKVPATIELKQLPGRTYQLDQQRVEYLRTIKRLCDQNGTRIIAFTSPVSFGHYRKMVEDPEIARHLELFKRTLVDIFGELWDFYDESLASYNQPVYFQNSNHASHLFSTMVLERIFTGRPEFGKLLRK